MRLNQKYNTRENKNKDYNVHDLEQILNDKLRLEQQVRKLEEELEKQAALNRKLTRIINKSKIRTGKEKRKRAIHHQRGYSDSVHNPINYKMISHHKKGSSGSGSSGNGLNRIFHTEAFDETFENAPFLTKTSDFRSNKKSSYEAICTMYTTEGNYKNESTTKQVTTKSKQQPSQAAIVTTTTTITTTPLQKQYNSGKHENPLGRKRCYDNVTQKRKWMIREYNKSKDLNLSEVKDTEEQKYYKNKQNTSIEIEKKSAQMLHNNDKSTIYKTQERIPKVDGSFLRDSENFDLLANSATLKRRQWKIKFSLKSHLDSVRSLYFNMNMNILASASEDKTIRLWKADTFLDDRDYLNEQIFSYMTLRGHIGALFTMTGPSETNLHSKKNMLYTAGEEGEIRVWKIPNPVYTDTIESTHDSQHCVGVWKHHTDAIWDLQHHPTESCLLSLSSDNEIALWMTLTEDEEIDSLGQNFGGNIRHTFKNKELFSKYHDTPTTCCWLGENTSNFISGFVSPNIILFDANTGTKKSSIKFQTKDFKTMEQQQPNKVI